MRTVLMTVTGVLLFAVLALTFAAFTADKLITDEDAYVNSILNDEFDSLILNDVESYIKEEGTQLGLDDYDRIIELIDKEKTLDIAHSYTRVFIHSSLNGTKFDFSDGYESDELKTEIIRQIRESNSKLKDDIRAFVEGSNEDGSLSKEDIEKIVEEMYSAEALTEEQIEEDAEEVYQYIKTDIELAARYIPSYLTRHTASVGDKISKVRAVLKYKYYALIFVVILTALMVFVSTFGGKLGDGIVFAVLPYLFASTLLFVPSLMFSIYDSSSRLTISKSPLYYLLSGILKNIESTFLSRSLIIFAISFVAVAAAAWFWISGEIRKEQNGAPDIEAPDESARDI